MLTFSGRFWSEYSTYARFPAEASVSRAAASCWVRKERSESMAAFSDTSGTTAVAAWRPGLRYNYNVIVNLTGINFTPSVRQWTTGTMETDLNENK